MVLTIDIGNTNIVFGCSKGDKILFIERIATRTTSTDTEYAILFKNVLDIHSIKLTDIAGGIISSVVPSATNLVKRAVKKLADIDILVVGPGIKTGLKILMDNPAQLGSDLVVDAVAGIAEYPVPLIIIDFGTATTFSVINKNKEYWGGVIMPGVRVSHDSLVGRTAQLPKISLEAPKHVIGKNTIECMKSGLVLAAASSIDGMIEKIENELGCDANVVATGGLASTIIPLCKRDIQIDDMLLLKGLMIIYNKNKTN